MTICQQVGKKLNMLFILATISDLSITFLSFLPTLLFSLASGFGISKDFFP